jgi:hypothetical protein
MSISFDPLHKVGVEMCVLHSMIDNIYQYEREIMKLKQENEKLKSDNTSHNSASTPLVLCHKHGTRMSCAVCEMEKRSNRR